MADEKLNTAAEEAAMPEAPVTEAPEEIPAPDLTGAEAVTLENEGKGRVIAVRGTKPIRVAVYFRVGNASQLDRPKDSAFWKAESARKIRNGQGRKKRK